jgi:hypothetical protein
MDESHMIFKPTPNMTLGQRIEVRREIERNVMEAAQEEIKELECGRMCRVNNHTECYSKLCLCKCHDPQTEPLQDTIIEQIQCWSNGIRYHDLVSTHMSMTIVTTIWGLMHNSVITYDDDARVRLCK